MRLRRGSGELAGAVIGAALLLAAAAQCALAQNPAALNVPAPELTGTSWLNTPGKAPLTLAGQKGKVTVVHFWTFG